LIEVDWRIEVSHGKFVVEEELEVGCSAVISGV
jgi:hypothetical protein